MHTIKWQHVFNIHVQKYQIKIMKIIWYIIYTTKILSQLKFQVSGHVTERGKIKEVFVFWFQFKSICFFNDNNYQPTFSLFPFWFWYSCFKHTSEDAIYLMKCFANFIQTLIYGSSILIPKSMQIFIFFAFFQIVIEKEVWDRYFPVTLKTIYVSYEES